MNELKLVVTQQTLDTLNSMGNNLVGYVSEVNTTVYDRDKGKFIWEERYPLAKGWPITKLDEVEMSEEQYHKDHDIKHIAEEFGLDEDDIDPITRIDDVEKCKEIIEQIQEQLSDMMKQGMVKVTP